MKRELSITPKIRSAFDDIGYGATIDALVEQTQQIYLADSVPWVVGYSGGKDSTAVLQVVWMALAKLPRERRTKPVHVISTCLLYTSPSPRDRS